MGKLESIWNDLVERYPSLEVCEEDIRNAYELMRVCHDNVGKILVAGNGGSASDSEHIVGELMKGFVKPRKLPEDFARKLIAVDAQMGAELAEKLQGAIPAIALVNHVALSTAYLNDVDPLLGFAQQLNGYGNVGDVFLAISTSGNSRNILYACIVARAKGLKVIGLTGKDGGKLKEMSDVCIVVPEKETYRIQELHLPVYHTLCLMLEETIF